MKKALALILASSASLLYVSQLNYDGQGSQQFVSQRLSEDEITFLNWLTKYGKSYPTKEEYQFRFEQFKNTLKIIAMHDSDYHGSTVGLTAHSDKSKQEFKKMLGRMPNPNRTTELQDEPEEPLENLEASKFVDWRARGAVTPVKSQGSCGSCWSFATVGAMEGSYFVKHGELLTFSEQQIVDCVKTSLNKGCSGGLETEAWKYLKGQNLGMTLQSLYPYKGRDDQTCKIIAKFNQHAYVKSWNTISKYASSLKQMLLYRPIAIGLSGENDFFYHYTGDVITRGCSNELSHSVIAVGYGQKPDGQEYFIIKNSWGPYWGEKGYARIAPDQCGVTLDASYVIAE